MGLQSQLSSFGCWATTSTTLGQDEFSLSVQPLPLPAYNRTIMDVASGHMLIYALCADSMCARTLFRSVTECSCVSDA